ncbi:MAG: MBL fold metallo-hydrolase [Deltaproteobacteria bacterium]|nr:MBL fold metallo-hydrolase [Deltaproteobacteria bacterium]MBW2085322.1 MBL fold metallo-hydrolase [Deltaproteobacteria bacterium]
MPEKMIENIHWLGHDGFYVAGSKVVYFDPFQISGGPKADLIFITHEHFDHCSPEDVAKITKDDTVVITEPDSAKKLSGNVKVLKPGESTEVAGVKVQALPSYNVDKDFHPQANNWLGFIVELDGVKIYHTGDADLIPEMQGLEVDIALIPVSGTYVMDADQGVEAARTIKPKIAVPMHYGAIVGSEADAEKFANALKDEITVVVKKKE